MTTPRRIARFGWRPDLPDARDGRYLFAAPLTGPLPDTADVSPGWTFPPYDQGDLGSCTGNGIARQIEFDLKRQGKAVYVPSRLFIYYCERAAEGSIADDAGAMPRDGFKAAKRLGVPPETVWPYDITQFAVRPSAEAYAAARDHQVLAYYTVHRQLDAIRSALAARFPVGFGWTCFESLETAAVAKTGDVPMPGWAESAIGGHYSVLSGYDHAARRFFFCNSWGEWGNKGFGTLPYDYLEFMSDLRVVKLVE